MSTNNQMTKKINSPIVKVYDEVVNKKFIEYLEDKLDELNDKEKKYIKDYPTVYIHSFENGDTFSIYVGESNNVLNRTKEHYDERKTKKQKKKWQFDFLKDGRKLKMYIIGHKHFNKSLTLDIENRLIHYLTSSESIKSVNGRHNAQGFYYTKDEFEDTFRKIRRKLRKENKNLFLSEAIIKNSAIFKASPFHALTDEQLKVKNFIISRVEECLREQKEGQIIFVEGEAGTGKTVLIASTFYELLERVHFNKMNNPESEFDFDSDIYSDINCNLVVNHPQQIKVFESLGNKLNIKNSDGTETVSRPPRFINQHKAKIADVTFVDEAHLCLTKPHRLRKHIKNELKEIIARSRITVVIFDRMQILNEASYWEKSMYDEIYNKSIKQGNHFVLKRQLRMETNENTIAWINNITNLDESKGPIKTIGKLDEEGKKYVKIFNDPEKMFQAIKNKNKPNKDIEKNNQLSRVVATFDWEYSAEKQNPNDDCWYVEIGDNFKHPWNSEIQRKETKNMSRAEKTKYNRKNIKDKSWAEQELSVNEVGSTYTIHGFDLNYVGVIIGPSVSYKDGKVVFIKENSYRKSAKNRRKFEDGESYDLSEELLANELHILLTRGVKGLYIYAVDKDLQQALKNAVK